MSSSGVRARILSAVTATRVVSSVEEAAAAAPSATAATAPFIGTHSGSFHADEALAVGMLKVLPAWREATVIRSRTPATWAACAMLLDVGGEYDAATGRLDHHQASFKGTYDEEHSIRLSSAGLVYKHFGREIVQTLITEELGSPVDDVTLSKLVRRTYDHFVQEMDAIDNGVEVADGPMRYRVSTGLSSRVGRLNPAWNEPQSDAITNERFRAAIALTVGEFMDTVLGYIKYWLPARDIVREALDSASTIHPSGQILVMKQFCPWKDHLFELEEERRVAAEAAGVAAPPKALYVLFEDSSKSWRIQAVPEDPQSFACRKPLPAPWAGLRDQELSSVACVPDCIFIHAGRFIGGNKTYEGVLAMAEKALLM